MNKLRALIKANKLFVILYCCFALICLLLLKIFSKSEGFYFLNPYHHNYLNYIFIFFTWLGDGIFIVALALVFLYFKKQKITLLIVSSYLLSGIVAQVMKYFLKEARPGTHTDLLNYPYFIDGVTFGKGNFSSFPSGHTASAFALCTVLALCIKDKRWSALLLIYAILVGYSRIYIGQHFLIDVLAGSFVGVVSSIICWLSVYRKTWLV